MWQQQRDFEQLVGLDTDLRIKRAWMLALSVICCIAFRKLFYLTAFLHACSNACHTYTAGASYGLVLLYLYCIWMCTPLPIKGYHCAIRTHTSPDAWLPFSSASLLIANCKAVLVSCSDWDKLSRNRWWPVFPRGPLGSLDSQGHTEQREALCSQPQSPVLQIRSLSPISVSLCLSFSNNKMQVSRLHFSIRNLQHLHMCVYNCTQLKAQYWLLTLR